MRRGDGNKGSLATEDTEDTEKNQGNGINGDDGPGVNMSDPLTEQIIAAGIEVHRELGPGLLEAIYEEALCYELSLRGMPFERQKEVDVLYKDKVIKGQRLDLLVEGEVIVELKSVRRFDEIFSAQMLSYLQSTRLKRGLLLNFGQARLVDGVRRFSL